jgi:hypothetical protein
VAREIQANGGMTMAKSIILESVEYEMLLEVAKRNRLKPDQYLKKMIQAAYGQLK